MDVVVKNVVRLGSDRLEPGDIHPGEHLSDRRELGYHAGREPKRSRVKPDPARKVAASVTNIAIADVHHQAGRKCVDIVKSKLACLAEIVVGHRDVFPVVAIRTVNLAANGDSPVNPMVIVDVMVDATDVIEVL